MIARVEKVGSGVETLPLRAQDVWQYDFDTLIQGNRMLQDTSIYLIHTTYTQTTELQRTHGEVQHIKFHI